MTKIKDAASEFLAHNRVAVTGVSRTPGNHGSNVVYMRLRERGYQVFAVNPDADEVEGDQAYHDLGSIPDGVEAVVIGTLAANGSSGRTGWGGLIGSWTVIAVRLRHCQEQAEQDPADGGARPLGSAAGTAGRLASSQLRRTQTNATPPGVAGR